MTNCLKNRHRCLYAGILLLIGSLLAACTNRDDMFGNDMVPPSQQMGSTTLAVADPLQPLDIDVSLLPPGIYVLDVSAEGIRFEPQKVVLR